MSHISPFLSTILAGSDTPAAGITPPSSWPVFLMNSSEALTADAIEEEDETSVSWKNAFVDPSLETSSSPDSVDISRITTEAPFSTRSSAVALPRPEALI